MTDMKEVRQRVGAEGLRYAGNLHDTRH